MEKKEEYANTETVRNIKNRIKKRYRSYTVAAGELDIPYSTLMSKLSGRARMTNELAEYLLKTANAQPRG